MLSRRRRSLLGEVRAPQTTRSLNGARWILGVSDRPPESLLYVAYSQDATPTRSKERSSRYRRPCFQVSSEIAGRRAARLDLPVLWICIRVQNISTWFLFDFETNEYDHLTRLNPGSRARTSHSF